MSDDPTTASVDGHVDGTQDADVIDEPYSNNPEADRVDGATCEASDIIDAKGGGNTIFANQRSDAIEGGSGRDTYIVGPAIAAHPVVTNALCSTTDLSAFRHPSSAA